MKVVFLYTLSQDAFDFLRENIPEDITVIARIREDYTGKIQPNEDPEIIKEAITADILMGPYVTEEILSKASAGSATFGVFRKLWALFMPLLIFPLTHFARTTWSNRSA